MPVTELIRRSHAMAVEKDWRPEGVTRSVVEQVNNFHAEVSEAWEEYRRGRMELWWSKLGEQNPQRPWERYRSECLEIGNRTPDSFLRDGWKPEGFWVEVADLCIRVADTMGAYGLAERPWYSEADSNVTVPRMIGELHRTIDRMVIGFWGDRWNSVVGNTMSAIINYCVEHAKRNGVDLPALWNLKMDYNASRPHRHGGLRA